MACSSAAVWRRLFLSAAAAVLVLAAACSPGEMPELKLESYNKAAGQSETPCDGKKRCLVAYLTPWCPSCQAATPFIKAARRKLENKSDVGLMVVVGWDQRSAILDHAAKLDGQVFIDEDNTFQSAMRFSSVPHWWVIDEKRKITASGSGLPTSDDVKIVDYYIDETYGMKDFL